MATVAEVLTARLGRFGIEMTETEIDVALSDRDLTAVEVYNSTKKKAVTQVIVDIIPELLLQPDVDEAQFSKKWDRDAIMKFYALACKELGIEDTLNPKPVMKSISNLW